MARKTFTIHLLYLPLAGTYRVVKVTDSLSFNPGQILKARDVQDLCNSPHWKVTIIDG